MVRTALANRLFTARQSHGALGQPAADGASQLDGDIEQGHWTATLLAYRSRESF